MKYPFLNLIPEMHKKIISQERRYFLIHSIAGIFVLLVAINAILFTITRFILAGNLSNLKAEESISGAMHIATENNINSINTQLQDTTMIQKDFTKYSILLSEIVNLMPKGIILNFLHINSSTDSFRINGIAHDRNLLLQAQHALENSSMVVELESPLSNFLDKQDIGFRFTGKLDKNIYSTLLENK